MPINEIGRWDSRSRGGIAGPYRLAIILTLNVGTPLAGVHTPNEIRQLAETLK
jgi:hypothetical protein